MPHVPASTALSHLRVLDLTRARTGPTCVKQFADFGADVIKVEPPPGVDANANMTGPRHGSDMQNLHRNKRSLTLNLKERDGLAIFMRLAAEADVVVENFRPDVKTRLGIDYPALRAVNRRVVLASISGFGQDGPYAGRPGVDQIAQGMGGMMMVTGRPGDGPMRAGAAIADVAAGLYAALGIFTALAERERSGEGQWVQANLLHAQIALLDFQAARWTVDREVPQQAGNDHPTSMPTSAYPTRDGWINVGASGDAMWRRLCSAIGRGDLAARAEFADDAGRSRHRAALNAEIANALAARTSDEWIAILNEAGVPCGPIYTMDRVFADPQVRHLGVAQPVRHPVLGEIELLAQAARLSRTPPSIAVPTPEPGEHTDEILRGLGYGDAAIADLHARRIV
jgi:formyl-CoA transferase